MMYRPGSKNTKPDALSRIYDHLDSDTVPQPIVPGYRIVAPVVWDIEAVVQSVFASNPGPGAGQRNCLFFPIRVRSRVLQWAHSSKLAGHPGDFPNVSGNLVWTGMFGNSLQHARSVDTTRTPISHPLVSYDRCSSLIILGAMWHSILLRGYRCLAASRDFSHG